MNICCFSLKELYQEHQRNPSDKTQQAIEQAQKRIKNLQQQLAALDTLPIGGAVRLVVEVRDILYLKLFAKTVNIIDKKRSMFRPIIKPKAKAGMTM